MKLPAINPVLARESRVRMRGWKAPALITLYVAVLGFIAWFILAVTRAVGQTFAPELGGIIFAMLGVAQFGLLVFSAPGLTAGAIAGEREKQTLDLLLITRMTPFQVVTGKLWAAVAFSLLLMFASLPVYSLLFLMGGISMSHLAQTTAVYIVTVFLLGALGLYFSSVFRRTQAAVVASYGVALGWMLALLVASVLTFEVFNRPPDLPPSWATILAYGNPVVGLSSAMGGPIGELTYLYQKILLTPEARAAIWWKYCIFAVGATAMLVWLTSRRIRPYQEK
ncbi:MAG TPA: ABC transporter permease [Symbiobacteriaceae bacterium]|jgi:ABC-2 type transport system permease protein|nr:ABC transporter permease [Symbiobacteriaceae bacterium]